MRIQYYKEKTEQYKTNTKKLWQLMNKTINKCKNTGSIIPYITVDGIQINSPKKIANCFGKFYSKLGENQAGKIQPSMIKIDDYLSRIL